MPLTGGYRAPLVGTWAQNTLHTLNPKPPHSGYLERVLSWRNILGWALDFGFASIMLQGYAGFLPIDCNTGPYLEDLLT